MQQLWYVPVLGFTMAFLLLRTFLMAKYLDIPNFAYFSEALLISSTFCMLGCLGLQPLLQRNMPVYFVRGRERIARVLLLQCLCVACMCAAAALAVTAILQLFTTTFRYTLAIGLIHGVSQQIFLIATVESRSRGEPLRFAMQSFARAAAVLIASIGVALTFKHAGAILLFEAAITLVLSHRIVARIFSTRGLDLIRTFRIAMRRLTLLPWNSALVLLALGIIAFLLANFDRWLAVKSLPTQQFAYYAFAWTLLQMAQALQTTMNAAIFPMLARRFGALGRASAFRVAAQTSLATLTLGILIGAPSYYLLRWVIQSWFPGYAESIGIVPVFILIGALRVSDFWSSHVVIIGKERQLLTATTAAGALAACLWALSAEGLGGMTISSVAELAAYVTALVYLVTVVIAWRYRK